MRTIIPVTHPTRKLGKRAPRIDPRTLKLARYLLPLPAPPVATGYITKVSSWPIDLNDKIGDCVIAGAAHCIQQWTTYAGTPVVLTNQQVLQGYEAVGGYVPGEPSTDNGCDMLTACNYWRQTGFGGHKILGYMQVNARNLVEVRQAVYLFGNLYAGWAMPLSAQSATNVWSVPSTGATGNGSPGSWGGHNAPIVGYGLTGVKVVTWGALMAATWNFVLAYNDELYALVSQDWIEKGGKAPSGFNLAQLQADLAQFN
jgi:hypothetical protein